MRNIVFLASASAQKPIILMQAFYDSSRRNPSEDILLTNSYTGNVVDYAEEQKMKIIVTDDFKFTSIEWIKKFLGVYRDSILVSCGWPFKIPIDLISLFFASLNCHGSYLPDYRGSRAYMHYWANCSNYFGATIHYLNEKFDDGNVIIRGKQKLFPEESHDTVFVRTAELCGHLLVSAIMMVEKGDPGFKPTGLKRYFFKRTPEEFEKHRKMNDELLAQGKQVILTPHKILEE